LTTEESLSHYIDSQLPVPNITVAIEKSSRDTPTSLALVRLKSLHESLDIIAQDTAAGVLKKGTQLNIDVTIETLALNAADTGYVFTVVVEPVGVDILDLIIEEVDLTVTLVVAAKSGAEIGSRPFAVDALPGY